jgi:hypothetical protein
MRKTKNKIYNSRNGDSGKKSEKERKSKTKRIRTELFTAFGIPLILIIILGAVAYNITSKAMESKYEESANGTMATMTLYLNSVCNNIKSQMAELVIDENLMPTITRTVMNYQ